MNAHVLAKMLADAFEDEHTETWTYENALSADGKKRHRREDHTCHAYALIDGETWCFTVQKVDG